MAGLTNPMPMNSPAAPPAPGATPPGAPAAAPPQPGPGAQPGAAPGKQGGPPIGQGPVDPELTKKMIANCMNVVTGSLQRLIKMVTGSNDKVAALAQATVFVVVRVEDSLEQSGGQLNLNMTVEAGAETLSDIADAMQKAGVYTFQQKELDAAFIQAVNQYRTVRQQQGRLDPAMFQQIVAQIKQSEQSGTLDQNFPGLTQFAKQAQTAAKPSYQPPGGAAPDDGDGADSEDESDVDAEPAPAGKAPPPAPAGKGKKQPKAKPADEAMPEPGQNFPAKMLKPKNGQHMVKQYVRRNRGTNANPKKGGI